MILKYSLDEIDLVAQHLVEAISSPILLFEGEIGAGKTTLIKAMGRHLSVIDTISSPTFSLINEYKTKAGRTIYHFDCYRISSEEEAMDFGAEEYLDSGNQCFIEWANAIASLLPNTTQCIQITKIDEKTRQLKLE